MAKNLTDIYVGVNKNSVERHENDLYATPPLGTYALLKTLGSRVPQTILEPCAGRGHIAAELARSGRTIIAHDLFSYENLVFLVESGYDAELPLIWPADGVITNPPYYKDLPRKLVLKWIQEYDFVACFLRLTFLESKKRKKLFTEHPPSDIIICSDRISFIGTTENKTEPTAKQDQIGGLIAYAWFVWDKNKPHQNTNIQWVLLEDYYDEWLDTYKRQSINNEPAYN